MAEIPQKFGIVVLLDALGTRAAHIDQAMGYIKSLEKIQFDVDLTLRARLRDYSEERKQVFKDLSVSYFGDSVLLTYQIYDLEEVIVYVGHMYGILSYLLVLALENGVMFRGAISIGQYIQQEKVVLGPALTDAAFWHDSAEIIGAYATPQATRRIDFELLKNRSKGKNTDGSTCYFVAYDVPFKTGKSVRLNTVNWPCNLGWQKWGNTPEKFDFLMEYQGLMHAFTTPPGTEGKYSNSEQFVRHALDVTWGAPKA